LALLVTPPLFLPKSQKRAARHGVLTILGIFWHFLAFFGIFTHLLVFSRVVVVNVIACTMNFDVEWHITCTRNEGEENDFSSDALS